VVAANTLAKSARLSPAQVERVRNLGRLSRVMYAERLRTQTNEARNKTRTRQSAGARRPL